MSALREEALKRLNTRSARFVRLLQLNAPDVILVNELHLMVDAMKLLAPTAWSQRVMEAELAGLKPAWGFCAEPECDRRIVDGDLDVCPVHTEEDDESEPGIEALAEAPGQPEESPEEQAQGVAEGRAAEDPES